MGWARGPLLGFDTETTGVDVTGDRIVTVALVRRDSAGTRAQTWLIDPGVPIPAEAAAIHGITTEHARAHGRAPRGVLDEVAGQLAEALRGGVPVVAFNASFDLSLLDAELRRHGLATLSDRLGRAPRPVLDPLVLDRDADRYRRGRRTLGDLCLHYGVVGDGALHTAEVDVAATLDVLARLVERYAFLGRRDPEELHDLQVQAHRAWAQRFNTWREGQGYVGPGAELAWPAREPVVAAG